VIASQAEERANLADMRAQEAEANAARANERADKAQVIASQAGERANLADMRAQEAEANASFRQNLLDAAEESIHALNQSSHQWWMEAERLKLELQSVYRSSSWRITLPLRRLAQLLKWVSVAPLRLLSKLTMIFRRLLREGVAWLTLKHGIRPRRVAKMSLIRMRNWIALRPQAKKLVMAVLQFVPSLREWLKNTHYLADPVKESKDLEDIDVDEGLFARDLANRGDNIISDETSMEMKLLKAVNRWSLGSRIGE
jgi:hypothetical protein